MRPNIKTLTFAAALLCFAGGAMAQEADQGHQEGHPIADELSRETTDSESVSPAETAPEAPDYAASAMAIIEAAKAACAAAYAEEVDGVVEPTDEDGTPIEALTAPDIGEIAACRAAQMMENSYWDAQAGIVEALMATAWSDAEAPMYRSFTATTNAANDAALADNTLSATVATGQQAAAEAANALAATKAEGVHAAEVARLALEGLTAEEREEAEEVIDFLSSDDSSQWTINDVMTRLEEVDFLAETVRTWCGLNGGISLCNALGY